MEQEEHQLAQTLVKQIYAISVIVPICRGLQGYIYSVKFIPISCLRFKKKNKPIEYPIISTLMDFNKKTKMVSSIIKLNAVVLDWTCSVEFQAHRRKYAKSTVIIQ